jgi:hypothetical protein
MEKWPMKRSVKIFFLVLLLSCVSPAWARAEEIKIVFTGQAYASLYPCACPSDPAGGVSRRATAIKQIRSASKNVILVEAGNSVASGAEDQYALNYDTDLKRTDVYLRALGLMGYDALLAGSQEFSLGVDFLKKYRDMSFISSNLEGFPNGAIVKDLGWIKVGIIGLTDSQASAKGVAGWQAPAKVLEQAIADVKKKGARLVILLSTFKTQEDMDLLKDTKGVDVVINGSPSLGSVKVASVNGVVYLTTWWQSRSIGILTLDVVGSKVSPKGLSAVTLVPNIPDDEQVAALLPACFKSEDCKKMPGFVQKCERPTEGVAQCIYMPLSKVSLTVVAPKVCHTCRIEDALGGLKDMFGEIKVDYLTPEAPAAKEILKEFKVTMLPVYVFGKDLEKSPVFVRYSSFFDKGSQSYLLKPTHGGVSFLLDRNQIEKRLDVIFGMKGASGDTVKLLKAFHEKHPDIMIHYHWLAVQEKDGALLAKGGLPEIEEFKRASCIDELYPERLLDYLSCRIPQQESSYWDECAAQAKIDPVRIKHCALSQEGLDLLKKRIDLTQKLEIASSPTFIIDNTEIFALVNTPLLEEFEKVVLGQEPKKGQQEK